MIHRAGVPWAEATRSPERADFRDAREESPICHTLFGMGKCAGLSHVRKSSPSSPRRAQAPASGKGTGCFVVILFVTAVACGVYATDWSWVSGTKVTLYETLCRGEMTNTGCDGGWERLPPTTYVINVAQQTVIKQVEGTSPQRLQACVVVDKRNWKCTVSGTLREGFTDGEYALVQENSIGPIPIVIDGTRLVARYEWLLTSRSRP
ncbi:MAG: hypothetical protein ABL986_20805 [Vicinamibacterales bacterium]